jgi:hypothetical protein
LGIDWGVTFTNHQDIIDKNKKNNDDTEILDVESPVCVFHDKEVITKSGTCSNMGSCQVNSVDYYGSSCVGIPTGGICKVRTEQYTAVQGTCSAGGHCRSLQGEVRLHHEACTPSRDGDQGRVDRVKQFIRNNNIRERNLVKTESITENPSHKAENLNKINSQSIKSSTECRGLYNPSAYKKLENICTDCYNLFKEPEVHTFCMSGCFDSSFFMTCVKSLMMEEDMVRELVKMVGK